MDKITIDDDGADCGEVALMVGEETVYLTVEELLELKRIVDLVIKRNNW